MTRAEVERLTRAFVRWAERETSVSALGPTAPGREARHASDLDALVLADRHDAWSADEACLPAPLAEAGFGPAAAVFERHGTAVSFRARAGPSVEVEVTLASECWAGTAPVDSDPRRVVGDGMVDRRTLLHILRESVGPPR